MHKYVTYSITVNHEFFACIFGEISRICQILEIKYMYPQFLT